MDVKMIDIARAAGVTRQAVSAVFNHPDSCRISLKTQEKIRKIAGELGYEPNIAARVLKGGKSGSVGIICSDLQFGAASVLFREIVHLLKQQKLAPIIRISEPGATARLIRELKMRGVDSIIFAQHDGIFDPEKIGLPCLFFEEYNGQADVSIDKYNAGFSAVQHLYEHGRRRIGCLAIQENFMKKSVHRTAGWQDACEQFGLPTDDSLFICGKKFDYDYDKLPELLKQSKTDALLCQNDYVAGRTIKELLRRGVKVPDDVAFIGFDGMSFCDFCEVPLATMIQPVRQQAQLGIGLLVERMKNDDQKLSFANIKLPLKLYTSASCGCPAKQDNRAFRINTYHSIELNNLENFGDIF